MKNIPQRTCSICRSKKNKSELLRIQKDKNSNITIDISGKGTGRGIYICYDSKCISKARKSGKLEKYLGVKLSEDIYNEIETIIEREIGGDHIE